MDKIDIESQGFFQLTCSLLFSLTLILEQVSYPTREKACITKMSPSLYSSLTSLVILCHFVQTLAGVCSNGATTLTKDILASCPTLNACALVLEASAKNATGCADDCFNGSPTCYDCSFDAGKGSWSIKIYIPWHPQANIKPHSILVEV